jgi:hypothetical protein
MLRAAPEFLVWLAEQKQRKVRIACSSSIAHHTQQRAASPVMKLGFPYEWLGPLGVEGVELVAGTLWSTRYLGTEYDASTEQRWRLDCHRLMVPRRNGPGRWAPGLTGQHREVTTRNARRRRHLPSKPQPAGRHQEENFSFGSAAFSPADAFYFDILVQTPKCSLSNQMVRCGSHVSS